MQSNLLSLNKSLTTKRENTTFHFKLEPHSLFHILHNHI